MSTDRPLRLFCALDVPDEVRSALDGWWGGQPEPAVGLRRVPAERMHVTVTFFGAVAASRVEQLRPRLGRAAARHGPFTLRVESGGRFDGHVLWGRVVGDVAGLRVLERSTTAAGRRVGLELDDRRYRPHVTLARSSRPIDLRPWVERLGDLQTPDWTAERLVLLRSDLAAHGPTYTPIASWPLGTASAQGGRDDDEDEDGERRGDDPSPQPGGHQA